MIGTTRDRSPQPTTRDRSPQHLRALARANAVRLARAELKRRIADGELDAGHILLQCPWEAASMAVADVLMSQRRWGVSRCRRLLVPLRISETKTVGALTERQRRALVDRLAGRPVPLESPLSPTRRLIAA
jgi:hypothetical protein